MHFVLNLGVKWDTGKPCHNSFEITKEEIIYTQIAMNAFKRQKVRGCSFRLQKERLKGKSRDKLK